MKVSSFKKIAEKLANKPLPRSEKGFVPQGIKRSYLVRQQTFQTKAIATFERKEEVTRNHIIFLHGGAYIFEATPFHWKLAANIVKKSSCRMTLVDYPLAPEHHYAETFSMVSGAYELLRKQYPGDRFILLGDSAGGGLALAFTQKLIQENHKDPPAKMVLLSPWLDITMSNPAIKNLERSDYALSLPMLLSAGMSYARGDDRNHYLLSPINGALTDLPDTLVFYGTEELFSADCLRFKSRTGANAQRILFKEYQKMQHDWALFPIPESKLVVHEICEFMNKS